MANVFGGGCYRVTWADCIIAKLVRSVADGKRCIDLPEVKEVKIEEVDDGAF